jgi:hypothetical protein
MAARASRDIVIPSDFPHSHRLGNAALFRTVLGGVAGSTFARWLAEGTIEPPRKLGGSNAWDEIYMAHVAKHGTQPRRALIADPLN